MTSEKAVSYFMIGCVFICIFLLGLVCGASLESKDSHPVEKIDRIDSLIKSRDSIKIKVEILDSIKDAKIVEIKNLSNDSTIKLFYELVKE